jgi:hypothetical protein
MAFHVLTKSQCIFNRYTKNIVVFSNPFEMLLPSPLLFMASIKIKTIVLLLFLQRFASQHANASMD